MSDTGIMLDHTYKDFLPTNFIPQQTSSTALLNQQNGVMFVPNAKILLPSSTISFDVEEDSMLSAFISPEYMEAEKPTFELVS
jgi:hypothetical protein